MLYSSYSLHSILLALAGQSLAIVLPEKVHEIPEATTIYPRDAFEVNKYASLGESYASGPSAGEPYDTTACRRYTKAFGVQVSQDDRIQGSKPMDFMFIACSGSKLKQIYVDDINDLAEKPKEFQATQLGDKNPDLVTLSIGGNDVGFVKLLDKCVYRFYQSNLNACRGCGWFWFNDCSSECDQAVNDVQKQIDSTEFALGFNDAIKGIFKYAPRTKLFVTGYPAFWNDKTDYCDGKSFKLNCPNNYVLPLTKDRRAKMNGLTAALNDKIKTIISNYATGADVHFVDVNPYFEGHRFCEEGVQEPSYRNPNTWFYPLEYTTGGTSVDFDGQGVASGDCDAMLDSSGDAGDYYACLMANSLKASNASIDLSTLPNNVGGDNEVAIQSGGDLPDWLARVFHPTINGMGGYKEAIIAAYNEYSPRQTPAGPKAGTCHVSLDQTQEAYFANYSNYGWKGYIFDDSGAQIEGCSTGYEVHTSAEDFSINCDPIKSTIVAHDAGNDVLDFAVGDQKWKSDDTNACDVLGWEPGAEMMPTRKMSCIFKCG